MVGLGLNYDIVVIDDGSKIDHPNSSGGTLRNIPTSTLFFAATP